MILLLVIILAQSINFQSFYGIRFIVFAIEPGSETNEDGSTCDYYLAMSRIPGLGRGVFSGNTLSAQSTLISKAPALYIDSARLSSWSLNNYVYLSPSQGISVHNFGIGQLLNHNIPGNIHSILYVDTIEIDTIYDPTPLNITKHKGDELFADYIDSNWFLHRNITAAKDFSSNTLISYSPEELEQVGQCLSHVYTNTSTLPLGGFGLFAKKNFKKNEMVTISPIVILPKHEVINTNIENYCIALEGSDIALFPLTYAAIINHSGLKANLAMSWYGWPGKEGENLINNFRKTPNELFKEKFAPFDLAYLATRDISKGEELFISYGMNWERSWLQYLDKLSHWYDKQNSKLQAPIIALKPTFYHYIEAPSGLFPDWWRSECIGNECDVVLNEDMRSKGCQDIDLAMNSALENFLYFTSGNKNTTSSSGS